MTLSPAAARKPLHHRSIDCRGYERDDGLFDIEAQMTDVKSYSFDNRYRGTVAAGEPIHDMWLRLTVDRELTIVGAEAVTAASPYPACPQIGERYQRLVGLQIGAGWRRKVAALFGGVDGCTHLTELLGPVATTAFQTVYTRTRGQRAITAEKRPPMLNSCHAYAADGEVVKHSWPAHYTGS